MVDIHLFWYEIHQSPWTQFRYSVVNSLEGGGTCPVQLQTEWSIPLAMKYLIVPALSFFMFSPVTAHQTVSHKRGNLKITGAGEV